MTIDIERLKTDAAYWDKCGAPEGATHLDLDFYYFCNEKGFWDNSMEWRPTPYGHADWGSGRYIPRPAKPAAPEWNGEGLPPVGVECELKRGDEWVPVKITGKGERVTVFRKLDSFMEHITEAEAHEFRPLRTADQRQREELIRIIEETGRMREEDTADTIIAAGWRKED